MAKLRELQEGMSAALQVPFARVRTVGAALRAARVLTTGPRGPGAPEMTPTDATNLLLGLMYDDDVANCATNVGRLRDACFARSWRHDRGQFPLSSRALAPHRFLQDIEGAPATLGTALDALFDRWVRFGTVEEEEEEGSSDLYAFNLFLKVSRPGYQVRIHIDAFDTIWDLDYEWKSPEQLKYEASSDRYSTRWDALNGPYMSSAREVDEFTLWKIVDCLRGFEYPDDVEEISPIYDIGFEEEVEETAHADRAYGECV